CASTSPAERLTCATNGARRTKSSVRKRNSRNEPRYSFRCRPMSPKAAGCFARPPGVGRRCPIAHPYHHALSSVKRWGGRPEDYLEIHQFFDESKQCLADVRHRALRHHAEGIFLAERVFGVTLTNSDGRAVPVRWVGEQHVQEDLGWIPTVKD